MKLEDLLAQLDKLNLPKGEYAITGSAAMAARGIREAKDIDIVVSNRLWNELQNKYPTTKHLYNEAIKIGEVEIGGQFQPGVMTPEDEQIANADEINGYKYVSIPDLIKFKNLLGRKKDLADIKLIKEYLNQ